MIINHNMNALNAHRMMTGNTATAGKSMEKLSSGLRINRAGDDAAGLAISEKMRAQIRGLDQASRNANDGISMIQTAEGALNETHSILQRMRELATQASNDTNVEVDRDAIQTEMNQLTSEINRIGNSTEFNTQKLLDGGATASTTAVGSNEATGQAARGAVLQSINPDQVVTNGFQLQTGDLAIRINGANFSLNTGVDTYNADAVALADGTAEGLKAALESLKTDELGVELSEFANVDVTENGVITITAKGTGDASNINLVVASTGVAAAAGSTLAADLGIAATFDPSSDTITGSDGTAAVIEGGTVEGLADLTEDDLVGKKFDIELNGTTTTVEFTVADLTVAPNSAANLVTVTQAAIDRTLGANNVTVAQNTDGDGLKFTQHTDTIPADGSTPSLKISGDYASTLLGGITEGANASGGTFTATLQIGANEGQSFEVSIGDMRGKALGVSGDISGASASTEGAEFTTTASVTNGTSSTNSEYALDLSDHDKATNAIKVINDAINTVSTQRATLGAAQNRLEHTINNLGTSSENLTSAESRVRDVDMAKEMMTFSKNNILSQAAQAMLAQANQQPQGVLQLLR